MIDIRSKLYADNSHISEVEDKSRNDSKDNEYSTATDNADVSIEDRGSPLSMLHENITERATRSKNKHVTKENKVDSINLSNTSPKVVLTKRTEPSDNFEERLLAIAQDYPIIANRTKRCPKQLNSKQYKFADAVLIKEPTDVNHSKGHVIGHTAEHCHVVFEPINLARRDLRVDMIHNDHVFLESLLLEYFQKTQESNRIETRPFYLRPTMKYCDSYNQRNGSHHTSWDLINNGQQSNIKGRRSNIATAISSLLIILQPKCIRRN